MDESKSPQQLEREKRFAQRVKQRAEMQVNRNEDAENKAINKLNELKNNFQKNEINSDDVLKQMDSALEMEKKANSKSKVELEDFDSKHDASRSVNVKNHHKQVKSLTKKYTDLAEKYTAAKLKAQQLNPKENSKKAVIPDRNINIAESEKDGVIEGLQSIISFAQKEFNEYIPNIMGLDRKLDENDEIVMNLNLITNIANQQIFTAEKLYATACALKECNEELSKLKSSPQEDQKIQRLIAKQSAAATEQNKLIEKFSETNEQLFNKIEEHNESMNPAKHSNPLQKINNACKNFCNKLASLTKFFDNLLKIKSRSPANLSGFIVPKSDTLSTENELRNPGPPKNRGA